MKQAQAGHKLLGRQGSSHLSMLKRRGQENHDNLILLFSIVLSGKATKKKEVRMEMLFCQEELGREEEKSQPQHKPAVAGHPHSMYSWERINRCVKAFQGNDEKQSAGH